jgi:hypothetical protein
MTNKELLEKIIKDELMYGVAYIHPEKGRLNPRKIALTDEEIENQWRCIDGFLKESYIWVKKT